MSELEMEIGRTLGASCFFIYQTVKANPNMTVRDIEVETGLSLNCVKSSLSRLSESNVLKREREVISNMVRQYRYRENEQKETWTFH